MWDAARGGEYARPPEFATELVSTADDYLAFARMLLDEGRYARGAILAAGSVRLMMRDHLTVAQKAASPFFPGFWERNGWGFGGAVATGRNGTGANPGSYGWAGGFGTSVLVDPEASMTTILLTQHLMRGPDDAAITEEVQTLAYH